MKPIIGITVNAVQDAENARTGGTLSLNWNYAQVIADAGGAPLLIPPQADPEAVLHVIDALLIPGGLDIDPAEYGEASHPKNEVITPPRYQGEKRLFQLLNLTQPQMPVFGICYGCQFLNVQHGGSLEQHVVDRVGHEEDIHGALQTYRVEPSQLQTLLGTEATGQSWHHQAVARVGQGLQVVAFNADGTPEALEAPGYPFRLAVQWHPERTPDSETSKKLFAAVIEAARRYREAR